MRAPFPRRGFTLIELLVVIAIIAILYGMSLPMLPALNDQARIATCESRVEQLGLAIRLYAEDHRRMPARLSELWDERYIENPDLVRCDKTGREFYYRPQPLISKGNPVILACCDPATLSGKRPHRHGTTFVRLPRHGPASLER
jgi:prepilin-type N-terminal cleavage/methylation domain-containing protein